MYVFQSHSIRIYIYAVCTFFTCLFNTVYLLSWPFCSSVIMVQIQEKVSEVEKIVKIVGESWRDNIPNPDTNNFSQKHRSHLAFFAVNPSCTYIGFYLVCLTKYSRVLQCFMEIQDMYSMYLHQQFYRNYRFFSYIETICSGHESLEYRRSRKFICLFFNSVHKNVCHCSMGVYS